MKTILSLTTLAAFVANTAVAQVCMNSDEMHAALLDWYQESPTGPKKDAGGFETQLWVSESNDTWTLLRYASETSSCVVAQGFGVSSVMDAPQRVAELILNN